MPPQLGQIERVAGLEVCRQRLVAHGFKAGITRIAGRARRSQSDGLARHRVVDRPDIEVTDQIGGIEREAASPGHDAGEVVVGVEVARDVRRAAQPDPRLDVGRHGRQGIVLGKSGNVTRDRYGAHVDRVPAAFLSALPDPLKRGRERHHLPLKIEAFQVVRVEVAACYLRRRHKALCLEPCVEARKIRGQCSGRTAGLLHRWPGFAQTPDHKRRAGRKQIEVQRLLGGYLPDSPWVRPRHYACTTDSRELCRAAIAGSCRAESATV